MAQSRGEGGIDDPADGFAQSGFVDEAPAHVEQFRVADCPVARGQALETRVGAEAVEAAQEPFLQLVARYHLATDQGFEGPGEVDAQVGLLEYVEQTRHGPTPADLVLEEAQLGRLVLGLQRAEQEAMFVFVAPPDLRITRQAGIQRAEGIAHLPLQACDMNSSGSRGCSRAW